MGSVPLGLGELGAWLGFSFIALKTLIRFVCRRLARRKFVIAEHVAWFGVDASVLSLVTWVNHDLPSMCSFEYGETVMAYVIVGGVVVTCGVAYTTFAWAEKTARLPAFWTAPTLVLTACRA
jgi:hypothetical protein